MNDSFRNLGRNEKETCGNLRLAKTFDQFYLVLGFLKVKTVRLFGIFNDGHLSGNYQGNSQNAEGT